MEGAKGKPRASGIEFAKASSELSKRVSFKPEHLRAAKAALADMDRPLPDIAASVAEAVETWKALADKAMKVLDDVQGKLNLANPSQVTELLANAIVITRGAARLVNWVDSLSPEKKASLAEKFPVHLL